MNDPGLGPAPNMADSNHASGSNKFLSLPTPPSQSPIVGNAAPPKRIINRIPLDFNKLKQAGLDIKLAEALRKQSSTTMSASTTSSASPATTAATTTTQSATMTRAAAAASIEQKQKSVPPIRKNKSSISNYIDKVIPEQTEAERSQHVKAMIKNRILNKGRSTSTLSHPKSSTATMTAPKATPSSATTNIFMSPIAKADVTVRTKQPPLVLNLVNQLPKHRTLCGPSIQQLSRQQEQAVPQPQPQPQPQPVATLIQKAPSPPLIVLENKVLAPEEKIDLSDLRLPSSSTIPQASRPQGKPVPVMARQDQAYPGPSSSKTAKTKVILNANKLKVSREKLAEMAKEIHNQVKQVKKQPVPASVSPLKTLVTTEEISPILVSSFPSPSPSPLPSPSSAAKVLTAVDFIAQLTADNSLDQSSFIELSPEEQMMSALFGSRGGGMQPTEEEPPPVQRPEEELPIGKILKLEEMDILHATLDVNEDRESVLRFSPNAIKLQNSAVAPEANMGLVLTEESQLQEMVQKEAVPAEMADETTTETSKDEAGVTDEKFREMSKDEAGMTEEKAREIPKSQGLMTEETAREMSKNYSLLAEKTVTEMSKNELRMSEEATDQQMAESDVQSNSAPDAAPSKENEDKPQPAKRVPRFKKGKINLVQRSKRVNPPKPKEDLLDQKLNDAKRTRFDVEQDEEEPTMDQSFLEDSYGRGREVEVIKQVDDSLPAKDKVNLHLSSVKNNLQVHADADVGESAVEEEAVVRETNKEEHSTKEDPEEILVTKGAHELEPQEDMPSKPSTERDLNQLYHPPKMPKNKTSKSNNREGESEPATMSSSSSNVSLLLDVLNQEPPAAQGEALLPFRKQSQSETQSQPSVSTGIDNLMSHLSAEKILPQIKRVSPIPTSTSNQAVPRKKLVKTRPALNKRTPRIGSTAAGHLVSAGGGGGAGGRMATSSTSDDDGSVFLGFDNKEEEQPVEKAATLKQDKQVRFHETDISDDATPDYDETEEEQQENQKKSTNEDQSETKDVKEADNTDSKGNASPIQIETLYSLEVVEDSKKCKDRAEIYTEQDMNELPDSQIQSNAIHPRNEGSSKEEQPSASAVPENMATADTPNVSESTKITNMEPARGSESKFNENKPNEMESNEPKTNQIEPDLKEIGIRLEEPPEEPPVQAEGKRKPRGRPKKLTTRANNIVEPNEVDLLSCGKRKRTSRSSSTESVPVQPQAIPAEADQPQSAADGTPSISSKRKRQARRSSPTTAVKVPAKRGRKRLAAATEATPTTTPAPETLNKLQLEEDAAEVTPTPKRGRPKQVKKLNVEEQDVATNVETTPKTQDAFQMRLLLIRKREQLDTNEDLHEQGKGQGKGPLQCGLCLGRTTKANWNNHLRQHYGVGWVLTEQEPQQTLTRQAVLNMMKGYLKDGHSTFLTCRMCNRQLGSGLGMLTHLESCGDNARPECQYCKRSYTKLYLRLHEQTCRQRSMVQQHHEEEDNSEIEADTATTVQAPKTSESKPKSDTTSPFSNINWIKRLLLIRKREQLDTNEKLCEEGNGKGPLQCGLCLARSTKDMWHPHLRQHYGVGWIKGKEPQTLTRQSVIGMMIAYLKQGHAKHLDCRLCGRQLGSGLGMLMHLESCGSNDRLECQHCKRSYTRLYHPAHEKSCKKRPGLQQKDENTAEAASSAASTGPVYTNAGYAKRRSTIKAENKLKKMEADTNPKGDFEGDSSEYDMNQDNESSEEYDSEVVDSNEDAAQTEDDISPSDRPRSKLIKRAKRRNLDGNSMRSDRQTGGTNCQPLYSRYAKLKQKVEQKWNQFTETNYAAEALYPQLKPGYSRLSSAEASELLPVKDNRSMRYAYGNVETADDWRKLAPLESFQTADEHIGYLGAPIKQLAWAPLPPTVTEQYLLCSFRKQMLAHARHMPQKQADALLMLLKCTLSSSEKQREVWPLETRLHYGIRVPNGPVHSFAFMPSGGYDKLANRLGLLAVASSLSEVKIYALPLELEDMVTGNVVVELQPTLSLTMDVQNPVKDLCTKICWSEAAGHNLLVTGYASGHVAFWDISDEQGINCFKRNSHVYFVPLHYFYFGENNIQTLELHYDTNGPRWLAIGTSTRKFWIYDIINWTQPLPINEDSIPNLYLANAIWPPIWETLVVGCSDVQRRFYSRLISLSPAGVLFTNKTLDYTVSSARAMHYNVWDNIQVVGTENGDLVFLNARELNAEPILLKMLNKCRAVSSSNLCNLNTESNPADDTPITTDDFLRDFGVNVKPLAGVPKSQKNAYIDPKRLPKAYELLAMTRLNIVRCNWNSPAHSWVAVGAEHGLLRIVNFDRDKFF